MHGCAAAVVILESNGHPQGVKLVCPSVDVETKRKLSFSDVVTPSTEPDRFLFCSAARSLFRKRREQQSPLAGRISHL